MSLYGFMNAEELPTIVNVRPSALESIANQIRWEFFEDY
jgi:hypothetical protein